MRIDQEAVNFKIIVCIVVWVLAVSFCVLTYSMSLMGGKAKYIVSVDTYLSSIKSLIR